VRVSGLVDGAAAIVGAVPKAVAVVAARECLRNVRRSMRYLRA